MLYNKDEVINIAIEYKRFSKTKKSFEEDRNKETAKKLKNQIDYLKQYAPYEIIATLCSNMEVGDIEKVNLDQLEKMCLDILSE